MKRIYITIMILLSCCCFVFAQRDYSMYLKSDYKSDTITMQNYAYICDTLQNYEINLYNLTNHPNRDAVRYKDGSPKEQYVDIIEHSRSTNLLLHGIVDEGFTQEQVEMIDNKRLIILIDISSTDGSITDVYFTFFKDTYYAQLPIEVFREMELRFKNEIKFNLTEEGKKMTHYSMAWSQCPKGRAESLPKEEAEEDDSETINTNIGTININKGTPTTNRGAMTPIGGFGKGTTTNP